MWVAHRQVASIRNRSCRPERVSQAATWRARWRNAAISQRARPGTSSKQISLVQQTRSIAVSTVSSHALFSFQALHGKFRRPVALGLSDPVLDAGVLAVSQFESGGLVGDYPGSGVGQERGDPVPVDVGEPQLSPGMWPFFAQDQPGSLGPGVEVDHAGGLGHPGALT